MSNYWEQLKIEAMTEEATQTNDVKRLRELAYEHVEVTRAVAKNSNTPTSLLLALTALNDVQVKFALLQNPSLPKECFLEIAKDSNRVIAKALAICVRTPPEVLEVLANKPHKEILVAVAQNLQTPPEVLERFSAHRWPEVYRAAQKNPKNPLYVEGTPTHRWTRKIRLQDLNAIPLLVIDTMVKSTDRSQRCFAAQQVSLSIEQMRLLARDESLDVRVALAYNGALSEEVLRILLADNSPEVWRRLTYNARLSNEQKQFVLFWLLQSNEQQRIIAAWSGLLNSEQLEALSRDPSPIVRVEIAKNRNITEEIIGHLLKDPEVSVRRALRDGLRYNQGISEERRQQLVDSLAEPIIQLPSIQPRAIAAALLAPLLPPLVRPQGLAVKRPKPINTTRLGLAFLGLSLGFIFLFASTNEGLYVMPAVVFLFLSLGVFSMNATQREKERRRLIGLLVIFASALSLPFLFFIEAPVWVASVLCAVLVLGLFVVFTS
jgi:hypothetical protein